MNWIKVEDVGADNVAFILDIAFNSIPWGLPGGHGPVPGSGDKSICLFAVPVKNDPELCEIRLVNVKPPGEEAAVDSGLLFYVPRKMLAALAKLTEQEEDDAKPSP